MKLLTPLAALLLAVPLAGVAADGVADVAAVEAALLGGWQPAVARPGAAGGAETWVPKPNEPILEFHADHTFRMHYPCGPLRSALKARHQPLIASGSWRLTEDGRLHMEAMQGDNELDETIPLGWANGRLQFLEENRTAVEFLRFTQALPVQCG